MTTPPNPLPVDDSKGGALNLTRFSGIGAALAVAATAFNESWETIFGADTPRWAKPVVIISVIAAFAVVAAADILSRGYASGRRGAIIPMPVGLTAELIPGPAQQVGVVAVRFRRTEDDSSEFLIVKDDKSATWVGRDDLRFENEPEPDERRPARATAEERDMH